MAQPKLLDIVLLCGCAATTLPASGQCIPTWAAYSGPQLDNGVYCVGTWDSDGSGPRSPVVVAGGNFENAGNTPLNWVGMYDGSAWLPMGPGVNGSVRSTCLYDAGGGGPAIPQVVMGGFFSAGGSRSIGRFDGASWLPFGTGVGESGTYVACIASHAGWLVAGGTFFTAGGVPVLGLARWDGAAWHAFPDELAAGPNTMALIGGSLYAGGRFFTPGGTTERTGILRWQDPQWVMVGAAPPNDDVRALAHFRGQLIVAGDFLNVGFHIAAFDGTSWNPLGSGTDGRIRALCVFDPDGPGPMSDLLIAGGDFSSAGGQPANFIAAWDGTNWSPLGSGTSGSVRALTVWNNQLVVGGLFYTAGGLVSPGMAFWGCPLQLPCYPNCDASTAPPILNIADFVCFLNSFSAASPYANCDNSTAPPTLNIADFICFLNKYAAGCP